MHTVEIYFQNTCFSFNCDDPQKLQLLAAKVNERAAAVHHSSHNTFDSKILLLTAILLQEEIEQLQTRVVELEQHSQNQIQAANHSLATTIEKIASYIENLASHLEKA